jgi:hypothetical protein
MSALCQKRTNATQQNGCELVRSKHNMGRKTGGNYATANSVCLSQSSSIRGLAGGHHVARVEPKHCVGRSGSCRRAAVAHSGERTEVFGKTLRDQTAMSSQTEWPDASALGYARSSHSDAAAVQWLPQQPLPGVDGINAKIAGYGGGENGSNGFYGTVGSLSIPVSPA